MPRPAFALEREEEEDIPAPSTEPSACPPILPEPRIVGGVESSLPFLAALWDVSTGIPVFRCSATRLSASWLLSAAHCNVTNGNWVAIIGGADATEGPRRRVVQVHKHVEADIALLMIDELEGDNQSSYALVNAANHVPLPKSFARAAGYGMTDPSLPGSGDMEQNFVDVPVSSKEDCQSAYGTDVVGDGRHALCAGQEGCDSCLGDSGGPLFQFDANDRVVVIGVVSAGEGCGEKGFPGVYAQTSTAVQWMRDLGAKFEVSTSPQQVFKDRPPVPPEQESQKPPDVTSTVSSTPEPQQQQKEDESKESEKEKVDGAKTGRETVFALIAVGAVAGLIVFAGAFFGWWRWQRM